MQKTTDGTRSSRIVRNCEKKVGVCHSDAVTETAYDEIRPKHVALMFPNGERKSENKWKRLLTDLETCGVPPITQKDIMRRVRQVIWMIILIFEM